MAEALDGLGYVVDVIHKRDREARVDRGYELVVSERTDWRGLDRHFAPTCRQIFFVTSLGHAQHNRNVRRRYELIRDRRGCSLDVQRIYGESFPALATAHALAGIGNDFTIGSWSDVFEGPMYPIDNHGPLYDRAEPTEARDFERARRSFLYFASRSQPQKGLDLLLELFPGLPHLDLYVCSAYEGEPDFCACYRRELFETPNIHALGWVDVASAQFQDLARRCAYVVHPTCSDGQAGSLVQALHEGLIPIATREGGLDLDDFGVLLENDDLDEIRRVLIEVSEQPAGWHAGRSERALEIARSRYTAAAYLERWRQIVAEVTAD
jgi:glycosyltransferase involved in cell wall biosynthesis